MLEWFVIAVTLFMIGLLRNLSGKKLLLHFPSIFETELTPPTRRTLLSPFDRCFIEGVFKVIRKEHITQQRKPKD
ncbi:hypothetical protein TSMEX_004953 [Taenia solium]|eukprot:TsM_000403000 transcript=TsM_000403000 gene=TsM_000403000